MLYPTIFCADNNALSLKRGHEWLANITGTVPIVLVVAGNKKASLKIRLA